MSKGDYEVLEVTNAIEIVENNIKIETIEKKQKIIEIVEAGAAGPQGDTGATGPKGDAGPGVAAGGAAGEFIKKSSSTDYDTSWASVTASDISDFQTNVSANTDVAANTAARHDAVTVTDSTEINFTLTGQNITASIIEGSIDETKLDASTNALLDLANSSAQHGDNVSGFLNDAGYLTGAIIEVSNASELDTAVNGIVGNEGVANHGDVIRITTNITATNPLALKAGVFLNLDGNTIFGQIASAIEGPTTPAVITGGVIDSSGLSAFDLGGAYNNYGVNTLAGGTWILESVEIIGDGTSTNLLTFSGDLYPTHFKMLNCKVHGAGADCVSSKAAVSRGNGPQCYGVIIGGEYYDSGPGATNNVFTTHDGFVFEVHNAYIHSPGHTGTNPNIVTADAGGSNTPLIINNCRIEGGFVTVSEAIKCHIEPNNVSDANALKLIGSQAKAIGNTIIHKGGNGKTGIFFANDIINHAEVSGNYIRGFGSSTGGNGGINLGYSGLTGEAFVFNNTVVDCYRGIDTRSSTGTYYIGNNKVFNSGQFDVLFDSAGATVTNYGFNTWGSQTSKQAFGTGIVTTDNMVSADLRVDVSGNVQVGNDIQVSGSLNVDGSTTLDDTTIDTGTDGFQLTVNGDTPSLFEKGVTFSGRSFMSRQMSINGTSSFYTLLHTDGSALDTNYQYRVSLNTAGTGTDTGGCYLVWYEADASTWRVDTVSELNQASNSPYVSLESGVPTVRLYSHASTYTVTMHMEAMYTGDVDAFPNIWGADYGWKTQGNQLETTRDVVVENASAARTTTISNDGTVTTVSDTSGPQNLRYLYNGAQTYYYPSDAYYRARGTEAAPSNTIDGDYGSGSNTFVRYNGSWVSIYGFLTRRLGVGTHGPLGRVEYFVNDGTSGGHNNVAMVLEPERLTVNGDIRTSDNTLTTDVANNRVGINESSPDYSLDVGGDFGFNPGSSVTPVDNGDVVIEATNNTTLTFKLKGSDGTVRTGTLTLS